MKVENKPDYAIDDASCKAQTGKTLGQWFAELDSMDGLAKGRREAINHMFAQTKDPWWPTTIYVEYEKHHGVVKKDGLQEGYTICCTKSINAPVAKVYGVWTAPGQFGQMFGDNGKQDLKEGGSIRCDAGCKGTFTRIRPEKDLRFTWEHPGCTAPITVDVQFQDNKGKTLMNVMSSRIQTRSEADGLRNAWGEALIRLKAMAES
ncbi:MAG: SRPBCC domain-containing protein [Armatimonadetes bacterium]|nr:SRPBCC domain-containing protein [Armatimonadota bacterium]